MVVQKKLHAAGLYSEADLSNNQLKKKIRNAEIAHINFTLVVGAQEEQNSAVNVRARDNLDTKQRGEIKSLDEVLAEMIELKKSRK
jgi:threonyl-tRNA synthetase